MIDNDICKLVNYGICSGLLQEADRTYTINRLLEVFGLSDYHQVETTSCDENLEDILKCLLDYAYEHGLIEENTTTHRDLFDTKVMGVLTPRPSEIIRTFYEKYEKSPKEATEFYYDLSQKTDYIRKYRVSKDLKWKTDTKYGPLDITINLSKPEKDPKDIAAAKNAKQTNYPKCLLCMENEGYAGDFTRPARQSHRIIPITIDGEPWGFQYSPYVYYNEHCIVLNGNHTPMKIEEKTFRKLFDFVKQFPHYFVGSNADLPIVGGSILSHDHFQGGNYQFAMASAQIVTNFELAGFDDLQAGIVNWPMSVIRLRGDNTDRIVAAGAVILCEWRAYTDDKAYIYAKTEVTGELHNTITPIARKSEKDGKYELDLVLRNNITSEEFPDGVYHPHPKLHHIKKENIGLIEVMGLAVLPARLKKEMELLKDYVLKDKDICEEKSIVKHGKWLEQLKLRYGNTMNKETIDDIFQDEIGKVFEEVLEDAGVFKNHSDFMRFINRLI